MACAVALAAFTFCFQALVHAATLTVPAGGNLQAALDRAQPGDVVMLQPGAEFVGNFTLPVKAGSTFIVVRSAPSASLPGPGQRLQPWHAPLLARLRSPNNLPALRTAAGSHHWHIQFLEFGANRQGYGDILQIGDGSRTQNTPEMVPRHFVLEHVYVHGDPALGQKRCIALNAADVTVRDSYVADCKGVGMDTQAIAGWNGPGPYVIENNYLEGAGENVLFGGSDPAIPGLMAENVVLRRNLLSKPLAWRDPIIPAPTGITAQAESGGSLGAGTYAYRVVAYRGVGQGSTGRSSASVEVTAAVPLGAAAVRVRWTPVAGATEYRIYGRAPGASSMYWRVTTPEFVDSGGTGTSGSAPTTLGSRWTVKNVFELKNARHVLVEYNILENNWKKDQAGYAIVLTPRNSGGTCTWCAVEDVTFQYNIVRNVAAGFNILGYDSPEPSGQARNIRIRQNLFIGVTRQMGGNGWFMLIGGGPRDITVDHNTIDHDGTTFIYAYGGAKEAPKQILGAVVTNNALRHNKYGMAGEFFSYGHAILAGFYPGIVFRGNYLAGGAASRYPAGNLFSGVFELQFASAMEGDFRFAAQSGLLGAASDGTHVGADADVVRQGTAGVQTGSIGAAKLTMSSPFIRRPPKPPVVRIVRAESQ